MRKQISVVLSLWVCLAAIPALAQRGDHPDFPRANHGQLPPAPERRELGAQPEVEYREHDRINGTPHVERNHWYGHDAPSDLRYRIERPFEHGRFAEFGPEHRFGVVRIDRDRHRFWLRDGFFFDVALWDWPIFADWCWDCGDDFAVYEDVDHVGWYLLYDVHTGGYVHVRYEGR